MAKKKASGKARSATTGKYVEKRSAIKSSMASYVVSGSTVHVVPRTDGWAVKTEGTSRADKVFHKKGAAVSRGKDLAKKRSGQVVIHNKDGTFDKKISPLAGVAAVKKTKVKTSARKTKR